MKSKDLLMLILAVAVFWLMIKVSKTQPAQLTGNPTPLSLKAPLQLEMKPQPLNQTFTINSEPAQFSKAKIDGTLKIVAPSTNADPVYIGNSYGEVLSGQHRFQIEPDNKEEIEVEELSSLWYSGTADDVISINALILVNS